MRAISLTCSNCAAALQVHASAQTVTCSYCGTESLVQRRTRIFEVPINVSQQLQQRQLPVARQKHTSPWLAMTLLLPVGMAAIIGLTVYRKAQGSARMASARAQAQVEAAMGAHNATKQVENDVKQAAMDRISVEGYGAPAFVDINTDGQDDLLVIGSSQKMGSKNRSVFAFDGATGKELWHSEPYGEASGAGATHLALVDEYILISLPKGGLRALSLRDGSSKWEHPLPELGNAVCQTAEGGAFIELADKSWRQVQLETGDIEQASAPTSPCIATPVGKEHGDPRHHFYEDDRFSRPFRERRKLPKPSVEGMNSSRVVGYRGLDRDEGKEFYAVLGFKEPGTRVPMIAALERPEGKPAQKAASYEILWAHQVPGVDPLAASPGVPALVGMSKDYLAVTYNKKGSEPRVVLFARDGGQRLWDSEIPERTTHVLRALNLRGKFVYLSEWSHVTAFHIKDGSIAFRLGFP